MLMQRKSRFRSEEKKWVYRMEGEAQELRSLWEDFFQSVISPPDLP
jgi:hypothetical protein